MSNNQNSNNNTGSAMRYPIDMSIEKESDYIRFQFFKYKAPFKRGGEVTPGGASNEGYYGETGEGSIGVKAGGDVLMYMPQDVSTSMSSSWGGKEISNAAAGALSAYSNYITDPNDKNLLDNFQAGLKGLAGMPTSAGAALVRMGLSATGAQSNLTQNDILGGTSGVILNPNTEVLYGGPSIRNIGFKFKMMARSEDEAKKMLRICRTFQFHAAPKLGMSVDLKDMFIRGLDGIAKVKTFGFFKDTSLNKKGKLNDKEFAVNNFIQIPNLCLFKYMSGPDVNPYLTQYKACAITNVDVNFTPDGSYSTLIGGYPSAVELSLSFVETKLIYQSEISTFEEAASN